MRSWELTRLRPPKRSRRSTRSWHWSITLTRILTTRRGPRRGLQKYQRRTVFCLILIKGPLTIESWRGRLLSLSNLDLSTGNTLTSRMFEVIECPSRPPNRIYSISSGGLGNFSRKASRVSDSKDPNFLKIWDLECLSTTLGPRPSLDLTVLVGLLGAGSRLKWLSRYSTQLSRSRDRTLPPI